MRTRFFVGCEGASEFGYTACLSQIAEERGLWIFLDREDLHGGNPLTMVQHAARVAQRRTRQHGGYKGRFILLDADRRAELSAQGMAKLIREAAAGGLNVIWQAPCHEGFLLTHLNGQRRQLATAAEAKKVLARMWPEYRRPMSAVKLRDRIDEAALARAAALNGEFATFLGTLGFGTTPTDTGRKVGAYR